MVIETTYDYQNWPGYSGENGQSYVIAGLVDVQTECPEVICEDMPTPVPTPSPADDCEVKELAVLRHGKSKFGSPS